jgi:phosphatidate cytidylyltransferase
MGDETEKIQANHMLVKRTISALILLIISLSLVFTGGWVYAVGIALILSGAILEFIDLFTKDEYHPNPYLPVMGTICIIFFTYLDNPVFISFVYALTILTIFLLTILNYKRNEKTAAFDLLIEMAALLFITYLGSYLIKIRFLPNGLFWIMISIIPAAIGDAGAYFAGSLFGKHKLALYLSPNKTVEGYIGGVFSAILTGYALGLIANSYVPNITVTASTLIGCITGTLSPFGDLSKSIFKRQFNRKNTGNIIPGHGGILDRIDTWLWAGPQESAAFKFI